MSLVQAPKESVETEPNHTITDTVTIGWGNDIESLNQRFGPLVIDYITYFSRADFLVGLKGISC
jgi:hypothetical protein